MDWVMEGKPCCLGCPDFLPPWALQSEWKHGRFLCGDRPEAVVEIIECVHSRVCGRFAAEPEAKPE